MRCPAICFLMPAEDTPDDRLPYSMSLSSRSASSVGADENLDFPTVLVRPHVGLEKPTGCVELADGTEGGKIWSLIFANLFLPRAIVDSDGACSCELNLSWTLGRSKRGMERLDAGFWGVMSSALVLFPGREWGWKDNV